MFPNPQSGIVQIIVIVLIAIVVVSYFGIDLQQVFSKPLLAENLQFTWNSIVYLWTTYVYTPVARIFTKDTSMTASSTDAILP